MAIEFADYLERDLVAIDFGVFDFSLPNAVVSAGGANLPGKFAVHGLELKGLIALDAASV